MKKKLVIFILAITLLLCSLMPITALAENASTVNRYNVVFVIDTSISMKYSDSNDNRFEATDLFLGMLADSGNYVGTVTFNGKVSSTNMCAVSGNDSKKEISKNLRSSELGNDTNIGGALLKATELLDSGGNANLPSIIILLSDGNTDFDDEKQMKQAKADKETALFIARDKHYTICAVTLNSDGQADTKELKNIAMSTEGGMFEEVKNASDLRNIFDKFYVQIYGTKSTKLVDESIGSSGIIEKEIPISDVGVEEVNIAIFGDINDCLLTKPDGTQLSSKEMEQLIFSANTFKIIKLVDPQPGKWTLAIKGKPNTNVTIVKTYNVNLSAKTVVDNESDSYNVNQKIILHTQLYEDNEKIQSTSDYNGFKATLTVTKNNENKDPELVYTQICTNATDTGFDFSFTPKEIGSYEVSVSVEGTEVSADANLEKAINVGNREPVTEDKPIKKHINIWPFLLKTDATVDLSGAAIDPDGDKLNYTIVSSTWEETDYTLDGSKLSINSFKEFSKGTFEIRAYDPYGAYCTFNVKVSSTNIGVLTMIILLMGILIAATLIILITRRNKLMPFIGEITVTNPKTNLSLTSSKTRGQVYLKECGIEGCGFSDKAYFQATAKRYIYCISKKKPIFATTEVGESKKIKIDAGVRTRIYSNVERTEYIEVVFKSYKD